MIFKEMVYAAFRQQLEEKIGQVEMVLADLRQSASNETKSTAGDKHETALAMLQIEQANKRQQLSELQAQQAILNRINPSVTNTIISMGALIRSHESYFFISAGLGKIDLQQKHVFAISPGSPLGQQFCQHAVGDTVSLNGRQYQIISVE